MIKLLYLDPQTPIFPIILEVKVAGIHVLPVLKNFYMKHIIPAFINDNL